MGQSDRGTKGTGRPPVPWRAALGVIGAAGAALLPAVKSGSLVGISRLLAIAYVAAWILVLVRHLTHVYEGYPWIGLVRPMLCELTTVIVWGGLAFVVTQAENPQIPRLIVCGTISTVLLFFSAGKLEEARAALVEEHRVPIRRATEVLQESRAWRELCKRFRQIDFLAAKRIREWVSGPDTEDGYLSRAVVIALSAPAAIALAASTFAVASTVFPVPITPDSDSDGRVERPSPNPHGGKESEPPPPSPEPDPPSTEVNDDCKEGSYDPGSRVPEPERSSLILGWQDLPGVVPGPMEALGFEIAGCPEGARPIPSSTGSWYAPGYCEGQLRAVTIAPRGLDHPVVLLEQAAEFVLPLIIKGKFVSAVDRFEVGDGDAYIVDVAEGSFVLIREHSTRGPVEGAPRQAGHCGNYADEDVPYTVVGPGMLPGWRLAAAISQGGVYPIAFAKGAGNPEAVVFRSPAGIVITGTCSISRLTCEIELESDPIGGITGPHVDQAEVEALTGA
jgi:hypothetical protein